MGIRRVLTTGILLAAVAGGTAFALAPTAGAAVAAPVAVVGGPVEGPFATGAECSPRAHYYTDTTNFYHFCRYKDGSDGLAKGWWVWLYG